MSILSSSTVNMTLYSVAVEVVPRLPLIQVREYEVGEVGLHLVVSQRTTLRFEVTNIGPVPVSNLSVTAKILADTAYVSEKTM